jgi:AhpD family alkylhydroperoxidase
MSDFLFYDETSAPAAAQASLQGVKAAFGLIPGLLAGLAENPAALEAYLAISGQFAKSGLSPTEQQVVAITVSVENECHFCVAAHSAVAAGQSVPADVIAAVRNQSPIRDAKLEALRQFTLKIVRQRGFIAQTDVHAFEAAGYSKSAVFAVLLGVTLKTFSNYTNHIIESPLNSQFEAFAWTPTVRPVAAE